MGKAKEGSIWRRKTFGEWRRSRIDKKRGGKYLRTDSVSGFSKARRSGEVE